MEDKQVVELLQKFAERQARDESVAKTDELLKKSATKLTQAEREELARQVDGWNQRGR